MTVWSHLPTIFSRRFVLRFAVHAGLIIAFITTLLLSVPSQAAPGVNATLSFQGRLLTSSGTVVPDGHYNIQFNLYQDGPGTTAGNPGGTLEWTETYINDGGTSGVQVRNGVFSVNLGSKTPFSSSVDWNQDTLWLSMNVAGSATDCTTFDTGSCVADGEMLPMKRINSVPTAINSSQLGGKTANQFLQLAQGLQTDASTNTNSIYINKTGTGNLIQLQNTGTDVFTVGGNGSITLGSSDDQFISVAASGAGQDGKLLNVKGGMGGSGSGSAGGILLLQGGDAGGTNGNGGDVHLSGGAASGSGNDGNVFIGAASTNNIIIGTTTGAQTQDIYIGANGTAGSETNLVIGSSGDGSGTTTIQGKSGVEIKTNNVTRATFSETSGSLYLGNGYSSSTPDSFTIQGTSSTATGVTGGSLIIQGGNALTGNATGGDIIINGGAGAGSGTSGRVGIGLLQTSEVLIGNITSNSINTVFGTTIFKPTAGNDSIAAFQLQRADGTTMLMADSVNQQLTVGNPASANKTVISTSTGKITKYGDARNTNTITLAAEYAGSVLDAGSGSNNSGTMTSGIDLTNRMNYYKWTTSQGTNQSYDVVVQVPIPRDFDGWASSNPLAITAYTSNTSNGTITVEARDSSNAVQCNFASVTPGSTNTWTTNNTACTLSAGTYTAGGYMTLRLRMQSPNGGDVRLGNITLDYLSKY